MIDSDIEASHAQSFEVTWIITFNNLNNVFLTSKKLGIIVSSANITLTGCQVNCYNPRTAVSSGGGVALLAIGT